MSKLRDKFYNELPQFANESDAIKCEQITDDFAVKFADWSNSIYVAVEYKSKSTTELLQIFKDKYYE